MNESNSLALLAIYNNSDSESDSEVVGPRVSVKRCFQDDEDTPSKVVVKKLNRLPVPALLKTNAYETENTKEQVELHSGRIRSFAHERGNWSTYVYIPFEYNDLIDDLIKGIISKINSHFLLQPCDDLHISLTKTVVIRHHWIESFTKTISDNLSHVHGFIILFDKLNIYCNEERTRTFIGLQIKSGFDSLLNLVTILNKSLKEFNLSEFYEDPSFHMSLVWCVGDYENMLNNMLGDLNHLIFELMANNPQIYINVTNLVCKTGNKIFNFNLNTGSSYKNSL